MLGPESHFPCMQLPRALRACVVGNAPPLWLTDSGRTKNGRNAMNDRDYEACQSIKAKVAEDRRNWLSRRRMLQASAAAAVGAIAATYGPKEVFADVGGKVTLYFAEGKRWGDTQRAVQP